MKQKQTKEFKDSDPTGRYFRRSEIEHFSSHCWTYRAYDSVDGLDISWVQYQIPTAPAAEKLDYYTSLDFQQLMKMKTWWTSPDKTVLFIITESLGSCTIFDFLERQDSVYRPKAISRWFKAVLQALNYLHQRNIIHGKVRLSEIFIKPSSGTVKLSHPISRMNFMDKDEIIVSCYMAPEELENVISIRGDIWQFGIGLTEAVTRQKPFSECKSSMELITRLASYTPPKAVESIGDPILKDLIMKCLQPPENRPTAEQLLSHQFFTMDFSAPQPQADTGKGSMSLIDLSPYQEIRSE
ncbi:putative serine/threonine-protein kinase WNK5 [Tritrichomonas foetus]|uniref:Serine/threonine-protein kinase WNK5 n=1 Tax=Tritrichomonas foetus TaxID=1144522 RepID=A0A1J4JX47_9EUKA|nr:putative serine/threonine-protein kinase WNK5 [Tritrichomonas foetus]|eukprot:OHT02110.1 putative serine/threonine-protein kinase WNK5 [Tritrichomonas foetus]